MPFSLGINSGLDNISYLVTRYNYELVDGVYHLRQPRLRKFGACVLDAVEAGRVSIEVHSFYYNETHTIDLLRKSVRIDDRFLSRPQIFRAAHDLFLESNCDYMEVFNRTGEFIVRLA